MSDMTYKKKRTAKMEKRADSLLVSAAKKSQGSKGTAYGERKQKKAVRKIKKSMKLNKKVSKRKMKGY